MKKDIENDFKVENPCQDEICYSEFYKRKRRSRARTIEPVFIEKAECISESSQQEKQTFFIGKKLKSVQHDTKQLAFTLSEVLIILMILAIIAIVTIPALVKDYQRNVLRTQFDRAYSNINQAFLMMKAEKGGNIYSSYPMENGTAKQGELFRTDLFKHINGGYHTAEIPDTRNMNIPQTDLITYYTSAKGSTTKAHYCPINCCWHPVQYSFLGDDGIMYMACIRNGFYISFDVNGYDHGPNKWGVDLFNFKLDSNDKLLVFNGNCGACAIYKDKDKAAQWATNDGLNCTGCALEDKNYFKKIDW